MKLLMIFAHKFGYQTRTKTLEEIEDIDEKDEINDALIAFIHSEAEDEERQGYVETKLVKNIKWAARKNDTQRIVLHSFAHLAETKASPNYTKDLFDNAEKRLIQSGYEVSQTPFGYFLDLDLNAPGFSLARLFKSF